MNTTYNQGSHCHNTCAFQFGSVTITVCEVDGHGWRVVCSCVCPAVVVVFGGGDDVFVCLLRERHITNGLGVAVLSCLYFRAGHSTEATVRTNDETTQHSDALQLMMCAKSSL